MREGQDGGDRLRPGDRAALGRLGEEAAAAVYRRAGYGLVARNWRCALGELDLVVARGATLVVCEVKARRSDRLGAPHEAVTGRKQLRLRRLAEAFLGSSRLAPVEVRFDVASVTVDRRGKVSVHLFVDAF